MVLDAVCSASRRIRALATICVTKLPVPNSVYLAISVSDLSSVQVRVLFQSFFLTFKERIIKHVRMYIFGCFPVLAFFSKQERNTPQITQSVLLLQTNSPIVLIPLSPCAHRQERV